MREKKGMLWNRSDFLGNSHNSYKRYSGHTNFPELYTSANILAADIRKAYMQEEKDTYI
jgi:hypothetical protein